MKIVALIIAVILFVRLIRIMRKTNWSHECEDLIHLVKSVKMRWKH